MTTDSTPIQAPSVPAFRFRREPVELPASLGQRNLADFEAVTQRHLPEIDRHFDHLMRDVLKWSVEPPIEFNFGAGNVVLRFRAQGERYLMRVPKFSHQQIRTYMLARRHFEGQSFFPDVVYVDELCVIERYVEAEPLGESTTLPDMERLGDALRRLHQCPAQGHGPLLHSDVGEFEHPRAVIKEQRILKGLQWLVEQQRMSAQQERLMLSHLEWGLDQWAQSPIRICHGDLNTSNILLNDQQLVFIDWDHLGAYPIERDFMLLHSHRLSQAQRQAMYSGYAHSVSSDLVRWFGVFRHISLAPHLSAHSLQAFQQVLQDMFSQPSQVPTPH
jgi:thiamine kinase-like enzyme